MTDKTKTDKVPHISVDDLIEWLKTLPADRKFSMEIPVYEPHKNLTQCNHCLLIQYWLHKNPNWSREFWTNDTISTIQEINEEGELKYLATYNVVVVEEVFKITKGHTAGNILKHLQEKRGILL